MVSKCGMCLSYINENQLAPLPCSEKHQFHAVCIIEWWQKQDETRQSLKCPTCKESFRDSGNTLLRQFDVFVAKNYPTPFETDLINKLNKQLRQLDRRFNRLIISILINIILMIVIIYNLLNYQSCTLIKLP